MTYHYKSALLTSLNGAVPEASKRSGQGGCSQPGDVRDHSIKLSLQEEIGIPAVNAAVVLTAGWVLSFLLPLDSFPETQDILRTLVYLAALVIFWTSRKEQLRFERYRRALTDRQSEWSALTIVDGRDADPLEVSEPIQPTLSVVPREGGILQSEGKTRDKAVGTSL